jgi:beta-glucosidase
MGVISTPVDFVGLNIYLPGSYVSARDDAPGFVAVPFPGQISDDEFALAQRSVPRRSIGVRETWPKVWNVSDIYITENGCSATDVPAADDLVYDTDRIMTSEGVPVRGYFHWSLMDNFEWADGFCTRFGLLYVNYATQQRTPKLSASFYREVRRPKSAGIVMELNSGGGSPASTKRRGRYDLPIGAIAYVNVVLPDRRAEHLEARRRSRIHCCN